MTKRLIDLDDDLLAAAECREDGPTVRLQINDRAYPYWYCRIGDDRGDTVHWYLWNSDDPN